MLERRFVLATLSAAVIAVAMMGVSGCCFGGNPGGVPPFGGPATPVGGPTPLGPPTVGAGLVTVGPGFLPDPQVSTGVAGGPIAASGMSADCRGYIAAQPSLLLNATGQFMNLRIVVSSAVDTTLVVQRADGSFACNDDAEGLNPHVAGVFGPGQHRIWVGTYSAAQAGASYTIGFTELAHVTSASLATGGVVYPGTGAVPQGALIPQACGMVMPTYGPIVVGSSVVLGMHTPWTGSNGQGGMVTEDTNWAPDMQPFVGQRTTVTALGGLDESGCSTIRVAADNGQYFWRVRNVSF